MIKLRVDLMTGESDKTSSFPGSEASARDSAAQRRLSAAYEAPSWAAAAAVVRRARGGGGGEGMDAPRERKNGRM